MPRTKPADQRRADLMGAAAALFVERGIVATTLEDVTARAGVSKGLFYQYFHSKDDLLLALQEDFAHRLAERMRKAIPADAAWPDKLDAVIQACFRSFQAEHDLHEVLFRHAGGGDLAHAGQARADQAPQRESSHHLLVETFRALLREGVAAGAFQVEDIAATALLLACAMHAFDPTFLALTRDRLSSQRLLHATQVLGRRAAGVAAPPPDRPRRRAR